VAPNPQVQRIGPDRYPFRRAFIGGTSNATCDGRVVRALDSANNRFQWSSGVSPGPSGIDSKIVSAGGDDIFASELSERSLSARAKTAALSTSSVMSARIVQDSVT